MSLDVYNGVALLSTGAVANLAAVAVYRETDGALASIYSDNAGASPIAQPGFAADAQGRFTFYAAGLDQGYKIVATHAGSGETHTLRNVAVGNTKQRDATPIAVSILAAADAAAVRALLDVPNNASVVTTAAVRQAVRQTVEYGLTDGNGYANFLQAGAGLRLKVMAASVALVMSFANANADTLETINVDNTDITGANLPASNTSYVYRTAGIAWGTTLVPPQYGYAFDRGQGALLNFEGADASTTMLDDFGNTWTASGNAQLDTAQKKFGTAALLLDGTGDYIQTPGITTFGDGPWEVAFWFRINALPGAGTRVYLFNAGNANDTGALLALDNTAGVIKMGLSLSSNGTAHDIAAITLGTNTTWTLAQWNRVRLVFDPLAGNYRVYLSLNGAAETIDIAVGSTARVCSFASVYIGSLHSNTATQQFNGWIDGFRILRCATATSAQTPSAVAPAITDYSCHFFSIPEKKMYEVTAASAAAGTDPTMTRRDRLFVGEADTGAATVTAARNYALRGRYRGEASATIADTSTTFNHNVGVKELRVHYWIECKTAEAGYVPGDRVYLPLGRDSATPNGEATGVFITGRNTVGNRTGKSSGYVFFSRSTGSLVSATVANWKQVMEVERSF